MNGLALKVSILLMVLSFVPWILIPTIPLWPLSNKARAAAIPVLLISAEVIFWSGAALGGTELVRHRRRYRTVFRRRIGPRLRRWFRMKNKPARRV